MPVPPLQWINLTALTTSGTHSLPPPLMYSSMGYDAISRSLIIFGGESQAGMPQQNTYLLNLQSMTWSTPSTFVAAHSGSPPPRSRALGTGDFAANSRRDFLIYGGKGADNQALDDVWAYNFQNQFWVQVPTSGSGPPPRWGTSGGIDPTNEPNSGNNVSTVFYIAGGASDSTVFPSSDLYKLTMTGTLASDVASIGGAWEQISAPSVFPGKIDGGGTLISQTQATNASIVTSGGCGSNAQSTSTNLSCIDVSTYALKTPSGLIVNISQCPVPRLGPTLVPNANPASTAFFSQSFMLLGIFDETIWEDDGGLSKGEVAVLDVSAGTWARLLPAGDPNSPQPFPEPREGAAAISISTPLVGSVNGGASDTIVFGGRTANGQYLNDVWILRSYNATLSQSNASWSGFGNGELQGGVGASGSGVTVQYLSRCAQRLAESSTSSSAPAPTSPRATQTMNSNTPEFHAYDVSLSHKVLPTVSIATLVMATVLFRLSVPGASSTATSRAWSSYLATIIIIASFAFGIAGFVVSFTSTIRHNSPLQSSDSALPVPFLPTTHARTGFALFICLYIAFPLVFWALWARQKWLPVQNHKQNQSNTINRELEDAGLGLQEKDLTPSDMERSASPARSVPDLGSSPNHPRQRTLSATGFLFGWKGKDISECSENSAPSKGFEVLNRPRRASASMAGQRPTREALRSFGDFNSSDRRRSIVATGESNYPWTQTSPRSMTPPVTSRPPTVAHSNRPFVRTPTPLHTHHDPMLSRWVIFLRIALHLILLANCTLVLVALFLHASVAAFVVFLIWVLAFYLLVFVLAWRGQPQHSLLSIAFLRLRTSPSPVGQSAPTELSHMEEQPTPGGSPYIYHQPPWRRAISPEDDRTTRTSHGRPMSDVDHIDDNDDDDETERQRRMEEELDRREVHIVTVPRRRLWIANPT